MKLADVATKPNLRLAWRRITTGGNYQYRQFYRELYDAYELALEENLSELRSGIIHQSWRPTPAAHLYVPKKSGMQRPISLLHLEDQIVLQAFANVLALRVQNRRAPHVLTTVFSNVLASPASPFFLRNWRLTYRAFQKAVEGQYRSGQRWILDFDLAAFYDTVSHELLLRTAFPRSHDSEDVRWIQKCLAAWSSCDARNARGHGLPQGPVASDFLAEVFLLPIDDHMAAAGGYVRYVDDIRVFGHSEAELRKRALMLEVRCRDRGLIPQVEKFSVRRATSVRDALGALPSINEPHHDEPAPRLSRRRAEQLIGPSLGGRPLRVRDKTRFRYVLFRSEPSSTITRRVCSLMERHPEHMDAIAAYLARCGPSRRIVKQCATLLLLTPYEYVEAQLWRLLARRLKELIRYDPASWQDMMARARSTLRSKSVPEAAAWGAGSFLCAAERAHGGTMANALRSLRSPLGQALVAGQLPPRLMAPGLLASRWLEGRSLEPGLGLAVRMLWDGITLRSMNVDGRRVHRVTARTLKKLGLGRVRTGKSDVIGEILAARFGLPQSAAWRRLLGAEYHHAAGLLSRADSLFMSSRSEWLIAQNAFNQTLFLAFQSRLAAQGAPGLTNVTNRRGDLVAFGVTLDAGNQFSRHHPLIADPFREVNDRRNRLPSAHPYDRVGGARTRHLTKQERNRFVNRLAGAYGALLALLP